jgi:hypothetical protein
MLEWPPRCRECREPLSDWGEAGLAGAVWLHKACWRARRDRGQRLGEEVPLLASPLQWQRHLELPMMLFLLLFHFGLATGVAGWILLVNGDALSGSITLAIGVATPLLGAAGVILNIVSRRRLELMRLDLESRGGWRPWPEAPP